MTEREGGVVVFNTCSNTGLLRKVWLARHIGLEKSYCAGHYLMVYRTDITLAQTLLSGLVCWLDYGTRQFSGTQQIWDGKQSKVYNGFRNTTISEKMTVSSVLTVARTVTALEP